MFCSGHPSKISNRGMSFTIYLLLLFWIQVWFPTSIFCRFVLVLFATCFCIHNLITLGLIWEPKMAYRKWGKSIWMPYGDSKPKFWSCRHHPRPWSSLFCALVEAISTFSWSAWTLFSYDFQNRSANHWNLTLCSKNFSVYFSQLPTHFTQKKRRQDAIANTLAQTWLHKHVDCQVQTYSSTTIESMTIA